LIIGIDFDNTIASYDDLMHRAAVERGLISPGLPRNKKQIRDAIRALSDGEARWRALQTYSYGPGMRDAQPMEGVKEFLASCKTRRIPIWVISHKTEFANFGDPTVNLRTAALDWLKKEGFLDSPRFGIGRERIFFEETREAKIARIKSLKITHFIDDLEETFLEDSFPRDVAGILLTSQQPRDRSPQWTSRPTWQAIRQHLLAE
jgi:hypothetical protein